LGIGTVSLLLGTILLLSLGQVLFKHASSVLDLSKPATLISLPLLAALTVYAVATVAWLFVLSLMPLSTAFPFYGLGFVFVPCLSWWFLHEPIRPSVIIGGVVIMVGVFITSLGTRT
jgi:undecaprenyl phosphate-alpha-L-ara4N flippase subunit ArnE